MHDIHLIRENPAEFDALMARRGLAPLSATILEIDKEWREATHEAETTQAALNAAAKQIGAAMQAGKTVEAEGLKATVAEKKLAMAAAKDTINATEARLQTVMLTIPNAPLDDIPNGTTEADNVELRRHGALRNFAFPPKEHFELGEAMALMDFETAAKISGARFVILKGSLIRLHRALAQFMLDTHIDINGLTEVWTPVLVRDEVLIGTGQLPKFADDLYRTENGWWLIPTAEVTLTNLHAGDILDEATLPRRYTAWTQCFRSEAGSAGKDTRGMIRQHQFEKVEMVSITRPEDGEAELERMTRRAENILERLDLAYRTVVLCSGDMGFGARRTHDIEVWLPGQNAYREISSCSLCGDFQARRMNARFRRDATKKPEFLHTLNGSGLAVGRTLIAVMENYQQQDGAITIPQALRPYMRNAERINADGSLV
ncbi:MAG TPA: serine--tRNA ligase [Thermohalobaculum sp.]|nr:serine--tRNA ligase [Thermohalobaculum sp.]